MSEEEKKVLSEVTLHPDYKEIILKVINDCEYGVLITFDEFASWIGRDMSNPRDAAVVKNAVSRAREGLESQGKGLKSYRNEGYIVVNPNAYETFVTEKIEKKVRMEKRIVNTAINAPLHKMNDGARLGMERITSLIVKSVAQSVASLKSMKSDRGRIIINKDRPQIEVRNREEEENGNSN